MVTFCRLNSLNKIANLREYMCNTTSNLGTRVAYLPNSQLAKCLPRIHHFSLPRPLPQLRFFYSLSLDPFASIVKLF